MVAYVKQEMDVDGLNEPISHYVDAVRFGNLLFISGMAPVDADSKLVGANDPAAQTRQILLNVKACLDAAGATFADILKVTVYLTNIDDRTLINPVRQEFFGSAKPASTLIGVAQLAIPGMVVEIDAVVGIPG